MTLLERLVQLAGSDKVAAMATSAVRSATRVGLGIAVARLGSADSFARFVLLMGIETVASTLTNASITMPLITVASGAAPDEARRLGIAAVEGCRKLTAAGVPVAVASAWVLTRSDLVDLAAFAVFLATSMLASPRQAQLTAAFRSGRLFASELAFAAGTAATLGACGLLGDVADVGPWVALAAGAALRSVVLGVEKDDHAVDAGLEETARLKMLAVPMVIGSAGVTVSSRVQPFALQAILGAAAVGTFGAAQTMVGPIRIFSASVSGILRPRLALHARRGDRRAFKSAFVQAMVPVAAMGGLLAFAAVIAGDAVVSMIFGASFAGAGPCLVALSVYAVLEAMGACSAIAVQSLSDDGSRIVTRSRLGVAVLGLAALLPAAFWGGSLGSAWSLALTEAVFVLFVVRHLAAALRDPSDRTPAL